MFIFSRGASPTNPLLVAHYARSFTNGAPWAARNEGFEGSASPKCNLLASN